MMTLNSYEQTLRTIPRPGRNDRQDCEIALFPLLNSAALDPERIALYARHIALGMDLFQETGLRPLFTWVDERDQSRLPSGILPYTITLMSALHKVEGGPYAISVWEMAQRENRLSLLLHHADIESPFSAATSLAEIFSAPAPSHVLYQELRFGPPYRYKPETNTFMDAQGGPPNIPAQHRFLLQRHLIGMSL
ncbi:MAG: hypothetical protein B7Y80_17100 [Hyphomicrobium sp. 32-62-53]|nr:MAG: hypothetical protein B7Z29_08205 [Hyphomicrobium sp. 12-62-95]OYX98093.1 MAG: hypothetical protein B7Y80_17100 [Hyphomicrobium sp. 32-62-53]